MSPETIGAFTHWKRTRKLYTIFQSGADFSPSTYRNDSVCVRSRTVWKSERRGSQSNRNRRMWIEWNPVKNTRESVQDIASEGFKSVGTRLVCGNTQKQHRLAQRKSVFATYSPVLTPLSVFSSTFCVHILEKCFTRTDSGMFRESFNWVFETLFHNHILLYMTSIEIYTSKISEMLELSCHISYVFRKYLKKVYFKAFCDMYIYSSGAI